MKRLFQIVCWLALSGVALAKGPVASHAPSENLAAHMLPVLCYHEVDPHPEDSMTITPHAFSTHMDYLRRSGYTPVRLEDARLFFWGARHLNGKPILISFDDGYPGVYKYALPILQHYKVPCVFFLVVGMVDTPGHVTLAQLKKLKATGLFEFGSHTYNLHTHISKRMAEGGVYPDQVVRDLKKSRSELKRMLAVPAKALAWPYGYYDAKCVQLGAKAGFTMQFTIDTGATRYAEGALRIRRVNLHGSDFKPENFKAIIEGLR